MTVATGIVASLVAPLLEAVGKSIYCVEFFVEL